MFSKPICFFLMSFALIFCSISASETDIPQLLQEIPESDRHDLDQFFQLLIKYEPLGYTLFGSKPISVASFVLFTYEYPQAMYCPIFEKGWEAWLRWRHLFSDDYFVLKRTNTRTASFHLINKKCTLAKIQQYLHLFKKKLGGNISAEEILVRLCSDEPKTNILFSDFLLGVFYGFGEDASRYFQRRTELSKIISGQIVPPISYEKLCNSLCLKAKKLVENLRAKNRFVLPEQQSGFIAANVDELNQLMESEIGFELKGADAFLEVFSPPQFVCWDSAEIVELQKSYSQTRSVLREAYAEGSFLENTLKQWVSPR